MVHVRLLLHHRDGRTEDSTLDGDGPLTPDALLHLPPHADHWWRVRTLRWNGDGRTGFAELEPAELPPHLHERAKQQNLPT